MCYKNIPQFQIFQVREQTIIWFHFPFSPLLLSRYSTNFRYFKILYWNFLMMKIFVLQSKLFEVFIWQNIADFKHNVAGWTLDSKQIFFTPIFSRNTHYISINTKGPDYVLKSAHTSIKVTVLPLTYAVYPRSEYCEWAFVARNSNDFYLS